MTTQSTPPPPVNPRPEINRYVPLALALLLGLAVGYIGGREHVRVEMKTAIVDALKEFFFDPGPSSSQRASADDDWAKTLQDTSDKMQRKLGSLSTRSPVRSPSPTPTPTPVLVSNATLVHVLPGEEYAGKTWKLKVLGGTETPSYRPDQTRPEIIYAHPDNKLILIRLELTNTTGRELRWESPFLLVDDQERTWPVIPQAAWGLDDAFYGADRLLPNLPASGAIAFEVPREVESYALLAREGRTDRYASVRLRRG